MRRLVLLGCLLLGGCHDGEEGTVAEAESVLLDVDIRDVAEARLAQRGDVLDVRLKLSRGHGVAEDGATLSGSGSVERFAEAEVTLYVAKLSSPAIAGGPCGAEPVSLALALHRRGSQKRLAGSLTPYCGKEVWFGVPARNPLRLTTSAPKEE